jgi:tetratricopeptide (TPR) repeat protein
LPVAEERTNFENRAAGSADLAWRANAAEFELPGGAKADNSGPLEAIVLYDRILESYPNYPQNDQVLYQKARAFDELGRSDEAIAVTAILIAEYPHSRHIDEVQFRRGEYFFTRKRFIDAEESYGAIVEIGTRSDYYELALYKLGWTLYKQMLLEEALTQYITLLDYKVAIGTDFDDVGDEGEEARIDDTFRVISLCFSDLGGADVLDTFFRDIGPRSYEDRVYRQLGEFYFEKLRYNDAALVYTSFLELYPMHAVAPHFSMRIVEIYDAGNFPKLVLEAKKEFSIRYGLRSEYWTHFDVAATPEVMAYLKENLQDLANHYHALYQNTEFPDERPSHFQESSRWYREYLLSFAEKPETAAIHYRFADLLLENESFVEAAHEYERTAYDYPSHAQSAAAGYAAVFAHREHAEHASGSEAEPALRDVVASSVRFADTFPQHEHAAKILAAASEDLYGLADFGVAIATGRRLIEEYPEADREILRAAWTVVAHASFDSTDFATAEQAYGRVLELTPAASESRAEMTNNLAASIYKQGEQASEGADDRAAADHFLRIAQVAPDSEIRPVAQYDAAAALIRLEDWTAAAGVLEAFRSTFPDHELNREATRQIALVYREAGDLARAGNEYERVAEEAEDPALRMEALLVAGQLYEDADDLPSALRVYDHYVTGFTEPIDRAVVTRFKMAELHHEMKNDAARRGELERIVAIDAAAGEARTPVVRTVAARASLLLSEVHFERFAAVQLTQPFDASLQKKQKRMQDALGTFAKLVDYGIAEVTAAATYYMAEIYSEFSRALMESERPSDLSGADLLDYQDVLEEQAFPFEAKAIAVHEKNLELIESDVFNEWIEKSLGRLAVLMPGRYAKYEIATGPLESVETYTYRAPSPSVPPAPSEEGDVELAQSSPEPKGAPDVAAAMDASQTDEIAPGPAAIASDTRDESGPETGMIQGGHHEKLKSP